VHGEVDEIDAGGFQRVVDQVPVRRRTWVVNATLRRPVAPSARVSKTVVSERGQASSPRATLHAAYRDNGASRAHSLGVCGRNHWSVLAGAGRKSSVRGAGSTRDASPWSASANNCRSLWLPWVARLDRRERSASWIRACRSSGSLRMTPYVAPRCSIGLSFFSSRRWLVMACDGSSLG
jgi:hypothetical protein